MTLLPKTEEIHIDWLSLFFSTAVQIPIETIVDVDNDESDEGAAKDTEPVSADSTTDDKGGEKVGSGDNAEKEAPVENDANDKNDKSDDDLIEIIEPTDEGMIELVDGEQKEQTEESTGAGKQSAKGKESEKSEKTTDVSAEHKETEAKESEKEQQENENEKKSGLSKSVEPNDESDKVEIISDESPSSEVIVISSVESLAGKKDEVQEISSDEKMEVEESQDVTEEEKAAAEKESIEINEGRNS